MDGAIGIGILGAGWITRAHGHALGHVAPLARPIRLTALAARRRDRGEAIIASAAEGRRVRIDEMTAVADPAATA